MSNLQEVTSRNESGSRTTRSVFLSCCQRKAIFSGLVAVVVAAISLIVNEQSYGILLSFAVVTVLIACIITASRTLEYIRVVASSVGLAWGFLLVWLVFVLVKEPSNVGWLTLSLVFMIVPLVFLAVSSPIWFLSRYIRNHKRTSLLKNPIA
jgi:hypothetical protein